MDPTIWLGVDPGSRETGLVLRRGEDCLGATVTVRRDRLPIPDGGYVSAVARAVFDLLTAAGSEPRDPALRVAAESVEYWPKGRGRTPNLTGLLGTAIVLGAVLARWPDTVLVPPGSGHGSLHESVYPPVMRPEGKGADRMRHARAAWDTTIHGETLHRQHARGVPQ